MTEEDEINQQSVAEGKRTSLELAKILKQKKILERDFSHFTCEIKILFVPLQSQSPDGGIGRRAGLKHQWGNPSRFEPGSGYTTAMQ